MLLLLSTLETRKAMAMNDPTPNISPEAVADTCFLCDRRVGEENLTTVKASDESVRLCDFCERADLSSLPIRSVRLAALELQAEELRRNGVSFAEASVSASRILVEALPAIRSSVLEELHEELKPELNSLREEAAACRMQAASSATTRDKNALLGRARTFDGFARRLEAARDSLASEEGER